MYFKISQDMKMVRELLNITQSELTKKLEVEILAIQRIENGITKTSVRILDEFYSFVYENKISLNLIKEMFYLEELKNEKLLIHGAKSNIIGEVDIRRSSKHNDF